MGWERRRTSGEEAMTRADPLADEHIREDVQHRLADDPGIDASDIEVLVEARHVRLQGTVPSELTRQMAEVIAFEAEGVSGVENALTVRARRRQDAPPAPRRHDKQPPIEPGTGRYLGASVSPEGSSIEPPNDPENRPGVGTGGTSANTGGTPAESGINLGAGAVRKDRRD